MEGDPELKGHGEIQGHACSLIGLFIIRSIGSPPVRKKRQTRAAANMMKTMLRAVDLSPDSSMSLLWEQ